MQVQELVSGGPAHACGVIEVGDQLLAIDDASVEGKKPADISHLIVGPAVICLHLRCLCGTNAAADVRRGAGDGGAEEEGDVQGWRSFACIELGQRRATASVWHLRECELRMLAAGRALRLV